MNFESSLLSMKRRKERNFDSAAIPLMSIALSEFTKLLPGSLMDGCSRVIRICLSHIFIHFRPTAGLCITCMVCSLHMMPQLTFFFLFFFPLMYGSVNVIDGEKEERIMITGLHTVVDIFCVSCGSIVGWKYVRYSLKLWFLYLYSVVLSPKVIVLKSSVWSSIQEAAHEKSQKYKEGKFILER